MGTRHSSSSGACPPPGGTCPTGGWTGSPCTGGGSPPPAAGDELVRGDAEAQDVRQVGGHEGHLGHLVDLADPLHGVQRVAQEVGLSWAWSIRIWASFNSLWFSTSCSWLRFKATTIPLNRWASSPARRLDKVGRRRPVVVDHLADGAVEPLDGIEHLPAQPQAHKHGEAHAHRALLTVTVVSRPRVSRFSAWGRWRTAYSPISS